MCKSNYSLITFPILFACQVCSRHILKYTRGDSSQTYSVNSIGCHGIVIKWVVVRKLALTHFRDRFIKASYFIWCCNCSHALLAFAFPIGRKSTVLVKHSLNSTRPHLMLDFWRAWEVFNKLGPCCFKTFGDWCRCFISQRPHLIGVRSLGFNITFVLSCYASVILHVHSKFGTQPLYFLTCLSNFDLHLRFEIQ